MANGLFDDAELELTCPGCGHKTKQMIRRLRTDANFTFGGCGRTVEVEGGRAVFDSIDQKLAGLRRALKRRR